MECGLGRLQYGNGRERAGMRRGWVRGVLSEVGHPLDVHQARWGETYEAISNAW
jgi:hypothetical protein